jgi:hypothetical protein
LHGFRHLCAWNEFPQASKDQVEASGGCHPNSLCFCFEVQTIQLSPLTRTSLTEFLYQVNHLSSPALLANISTTYSADNNLHKALTAHQLLRQPSEAGKWELNIKRFSATKGPILKLLGITLSETNHRSARQR